MSLEEDEEAELALTEGASRARARACVCRLARVLSCARSAHPAGCGALHPRAAAHTPVCCPAAGGKKKGAGGNKPKVVPSTQDARLKAIPPQLLFLHAGACGCVCLWLWGGGGGGGGCTLPTAWSGFSRQRQNKNDATRPDLRLRARTAPRSPGCAAAAHHALSACVHPLAPAPPPPAGQKVTKEVHWHRQLPGVLMTTAFDGLNVWKPDVYTTH